MHSVIDYVTRGIRFITFLTLKIVNNRIVERGISSKRANSASHIDTAISKYTKETTVITVIILVTLCN